MTLDDDAESLGTRLRAADRLLEVAEPLLVDETAGQLRTVVGRARDRLAITGGRTVVAVAGPTGVGKSSLINTFSGAHLAKVGLTRPTTSDPLAVVVGDAPASELLEHIGVERATHLSTETREDLDGLVLVDLPDHDSVVTAHRERAAQLVAVSDRLLWVVDPEKYADSSVHDIMLAPLRRHGVVLTAVLNQIDRLPPGASAEVVSDLRRLLRERGLGIVDVYPVSARTGEGMGLLRHLLSSIVSENDSATVRLSADLMAVAAELDSQVPRHPGRDRQRLHDDEAVTEAALVAAGVPAVLDAVAETHRHRARRATGWPLLRRWQARGRDPLSRLGLAPDRERGEVGGRSSLGVPHGLASATISRAVRDRTSTVAEDWPDAWETALHERLDAATDELPVALDRAIVDTDLEDHRRPRWWRVVGVLQWLLVAVVVASAAWLGAAFVVDWLQLPPLPVPEVGAIPWPTLGLVVGALLGLLLGTVSVGFARVGSRRARARVERRLHDRVQVVVDDRVEGAVDELLGRAEEARAQLDEIQRR